MDPRWQAHETAVVEPGADIGPRTRIWHHSHVRAGASIGGDCNLGKDVYVDDGARIGDRVKVQNGVSVFNGVTIGDEVFVGPSVVFTNDRVPRAMGDWTVVPTVVASGASLGANATIICGVRIGEYAMVGAGSVVTASVAPHELVVGNPAHRIGWVCRCGEVISRQAEVPATLWCDKCVTDAPEARS